MQYTNIRSAGDTSECGGIAQLGERLNGIQEVSGSIPLISTKKCTEHYEISCFRKKTADFLCVPFKRRMAFFHFPPNERLPPSVSFSMVV